MREKIDRALRTHVLPRVRSRLGRGQVTPRKLDTEWSALLPKSVVRRGNPARLLQVMRDASVGRPICYAAIGGSITRGGDASRESLRYADLVRDWWTQTFPHLDMQYVNAGVGGTATNYGAHRAWHHILQYNPDFVIVEFAVNDDNTRAFATTLEGLLRQCLNSAKRPAVILLSEMKNDGSNAQEWHDKVAAHYDLTTLSVRDMLWPEVASGRIMWSDIVADHIHPNDRGHRAAADIVCSYLDEVVAQVSTSEPQQPPRFLPTPMFSTEFERTVFHKAPAIPLLRNIGWDAGTTSWQEVCLETTHPGAELEFELDGTSIHLLYHRMRADFGSVAITIDDQEPQIVDGWFAGEWGGINFCHKAAEGLRPGKHRVQLRLLDTRASQSTGYRFQLIAVMSAGADPRL